MQRLSALILPLAVVSMACSAAAFAHHSFAMFDLKKEMELVGTVREFQWTNPHVWIQIDVTDKDGNIVHWSIESGSPRALSRAGWKQQTLAPRDKVTLTINPMRNGAAGGALVAAVLADGTQLNASSTREPDSAPDK